MGAASDPRPVPARGLVQGVWILGGGRVIAHASTLVAMPLLTRLYTPEAFGAFGVFLAFVSIASVPACLRFELAILEPHDDREAAHLAALSVGAAGLIGLLAAVTGWLVTAGASRGLALTAWILVLPSTVTAVGVSQGLVSWALRRYDHSAVARAHMAQSFVRSGSQAGLGLLGLGPMGLIAGEWLAQGTRGVVLGWRVLAGDRQVFRGLRWRGACTAARAHWRYPAFSLPAGFLNAAAWSAPPIALAAMYGDEVTGWFVFGLRVIEMPMVLVGVAAGQAYLVEATRSRREEPGALPRVFRRCAGTLGTLGAGVMAVGLSAPWWYPVVFGPAWREAGVYTAMLSASSALALVASPTSCLGPMGFNHWQLGWDAARSAMVGVALGWAWWAALPPRGAVLLLGVAMAGGYALLLWVNYVAALRAAAVGGGKEFARQGHGLGALD